MPNMIDERGNPLPNASYKAVEASASTRQLSVSSDAVPGHDYVSHLIITAASTAAPGAVTLFDGTTPLVVHQFHPTQEVVLAETIDIDAIAQSTKGFNVTTGTSVSVVAVGRFG